MTEPYSAAPLPIGDERVSLDDLVTLQREIAQAHPDRKLCISLRKGRLRPFEGSQSRKLGLTQKQIDGQLPAIQFLAIIRRSPLRGTRLSVRSRYCSKVTQTSRPRGFA